MTIYERVRAIQGAAVNNNRKAVNNAMIHWLTESRNA